MQKHYTFIRALRAKLKFNRSGLAEVFLITIKHDYGVDSENHTLYFYNPASKVILPVDVNQNIEPFINGRGENNIYWATCSILKLLKAKLFGIIIYHWVDNSYYTYLRINAAQNTYDININIIDALCVAKENNVLIYIENGLLDKYGIKLTKDILEKALKE